MARPNLNSPTTILGITTSGNLSTNLSSILTNPLNSNLAYKINTILVSNLSQVSNVDVSIGYSGPVGLANTSWVSFNVAVPLGASLVCLGKDSPIYMEEGYSLVGRASVGSTSLNYIISYESIT